MKLLKIIRKMFGCKNFCKYTPYFKEAVFFIQFEGQQKEDPELIDAKIRETAHYIEKNMVSGSPWISYVEKKMEELLEKRKAYGLDKNETIEEAKRVIEKYKKFKR